MEASSEISAAILALLSIGFVILFGYMTVYCYIQWHKRNKVESDLGESWLDAERKPLIPGRFHAQGVQPYGPDDDVDSLNGEDFYQNDDKELNPLARIIFVMRYDKKREELMVRLVQIEGLPVSHQIYSPNSAYVDVQLKYTGSQNSNENLNEVTRPPRLDICLQQVYYFIISEQQMLTHSLEFRINTFDEQFRKFVSGLVEFNLSYEMGEDILTGTEVVFVKDILQPLKIKDMSTHDEETISHNDHRSSYIEENNTNSDASMSHCSSNESLKWEPESSMLSLDNFSFYKSEQNLSVPLSDSKRSHSIGYLPTYEWNIQEVPIDIESDTTPTESKKFAPHSKKLNTVIKLPPEKTTPPPEKFYHIVPVTPGHSLPFEQQGIEEKTNKQLTFKKKNKLTQLASFRRSTPKSKLSKSSHKKSNPSLQQVKKSEVPSKKNLNDKVGSTSGSSKIQSNKQ
ncbi:uncharacterized protein LOC100208397 isoform X1 [Hydra vulgaris]|uniref:uncharacterized protein LOC100208397 isoform X1 n=1 Tax=Hydra vulgaris TaxID=6087 RepID=UPI001F5FF3E3|nr:uncharacterized protein LOC100208397 [Hydra vulgaris]